MTASKLGPHCIVPTADARRMIEAGCRVVKLVDDFGLAPTALDRGAVVIGRKFTEITAQSLRHLDPVAAANYFVEQQVAQYRANPLIKIWEGPNEPVWGDPADMEWYSRFEIARMIAMSYYNLQCAIGNFSTGYPGDLSWWSAFIPALRFARDNGHYLALHEYSAPWMWWMTGKHQVNPAEDAGDEGWTTLRYRKIYRQFLEPEGIGDLPLVITECGLDRVSPGPAGWTTGNWRACAQQWSAKEGRDDGEKYYAGQLIWYDRELQKDPYVVGACIFTFGQNNEAWRDYDIAQTLVVDFLIDHLQSSGSEPPPPPPQQETSMNTSFENGWTDVGGQQQQPNEWTLVQTEPGQVMGIPTKHAGGIAPDAHMEPAIAKAKAEAVHKLASQLPPDEQPGQSRALILDGVTCYKVFWGLPNETILTTIITGTPGATKRIKVPILGESNLKPEPPNTKLEDDNWWATVRFGATIDQRNYLEMTGVKEVANNGRNWNVFVGTATFPADGKLPLSITLQDNWGGTDWFIDAIMLEDVDTPPPPVPIAADMEAWLWVEKIARERIAALTTDPTLKARRAAIGELSQEAVK